MDIPAKVISLLVAAGVLATSGVLVGADPAAPPATADGLVRFADCEAVRTWYVDHALDEVGPYGWGGEAMPLTAEDLARTPASSAEGTDTGTGTAVSNGATGTNTQEADVDEPDVAKTDGRVVVRVQDGRRLVVTDVTGTEPRQLADWQLPLTAYADSLLLVGDHVLLAAGTVTNRPLGRERYFAPGAGSTEVYDVDISDPAHPVLADHHTWPGRQLSMRQYGDTVRLVTSIGLPELRFVQPRAGFSEHLAEQRNRQIVRASSIEDWAPGLPCDAIYHPRTWTGPDTVAVWTFVPGASTQASQVAVTGAGSEVYSSTDRLYVTSTDSRTHLHAFALDGDSTRYVASGTVAGTIRDRWSLDEHDGHLRVALSWLDHGFTPVDNGIAVLDERGDRLVQVGAVHGLGVGEQLQSVRWFDDLAVLVTFRQTDPLYTIDLSDPTRPRELGALKIPGFSSYLHPIGGDRLLGLGTDATDAGQNLGAQAAVLDLTDRRHARQVGKLTFGTGSYLEAADDPHAFTWLPDQDAAITTVQDGSHSSMVLLRIAADGSISSGELGSVGDWGSRALPLADSRVALVGQRVEIVRVD